MNNEESMKAKAKAFLNGLTAEEAYLFWRFLRTRIWTQWIEAITHHQKIK